MDANSIDIAVRRSAPIGGAALGLMMENYNGHPLWLAFLAMTVSLVFGIASSIGRSKNKTAALSISKYNAGALWVIACFTVFKGDLDLPTAMITALILGLVGSPAIEQLEKRWGPDTPERPSV